jgi:hypothetical protein
MIEFDIISTEESNTMNDCEDLVDDFDIDSALRTISQSNLEPTSSPVNTNSLLETITINQLPSSLSSVLH